MRIGSFAITRNVNGQIIPPGLHIPQNLANYPYVPHPGQLAGIVPMPLMGISGDLNRASVAGKANVSRYTFLTNRFRSRT